jgi:hypothetical protein
MGIGMGRLGSNQKYVVIVEVFGPQKKETGDLFDRMLNQLNRRFGCEVRWAAHADKDADADPKGSAFPPSKEGAPAVKGKTTKRKITKRKKTRRKATRRKATARRKGR